MPEWMKHVEAALSREQLEPSRLTEVREEIAQHLDDRYHALLVEGVASAEAEQQVLDEFRQRALAVELRKVLRRAEPAEGDLYSPSLDFCSAVGACRHRSSRATRSLDKPNAIAAGGIGEE